MFRLGLIVFHKLHTRTTIGMVLTHISYVPHARCVVSCVVSCVDRISCCALCNVPQASDTSIVVLGFMTHSTVREELQSCLVNVYKLHMWEGEL
jgi:hypothetical protein